jgi:hypothetical protein
MGIATPRVETLVTGALISMFGVVGGSGPTATCVEPEAAGVARPQAGV